MPSTYLQLTNRVLRRLNEVEIAQADFASARNIQATAKDAVLDTVREINASKIDWPFNAVEHSQTLVIGTEEYAWPLNFTAADWKSFQIQKDETLSVSHKSLKLLSREEWYSYLRDTDYDSENTGRGVPDYCFPSHGQGWGVSPSPDKAYALRYRYYKNPDDLSAFDDEVSIPSKFDYVITAGALYHMNLFKENPDGVQIIKSKFESGIRDMTNAFLPNPTHVYDGRVNHGGGASGGYWWYKG